MNVLDAFVEAVLDGRAEPALERACGAPELVPPLVQGVMARRAAS